MNHSLKENYVMRTISLVIVCIAGFAVLAAVQFSEAFSKARPTTLSERQPGMTRCCSESPDSSIDCCPACIACCAEDGGCLECYLCCLEMGCDPSACLPKPSSAKIGKPQPCCGEECCK